MTPNDARLLFDYNDWANQRLCQAARELTSAEFRRDLGSSYSSVQATLVHIMWAEWLWLQRWQGLSPKDVFDPHAFPTQQDIDSYWEGIRRGQRSFLAGLTDERLHEPVAYENLKGETWQYARKDMLRHVVNHSTYHRGQVVTLLRQLGRIPPATDFLVFLDQRAATPYGTRNALNT